MNLSARLLPGLPAQGPLATPFPAEWGKLGREGTVVELRSKAETWVVNIRPGLGGLEFAAVHPDEQHAVVLDAGELWVLDPVKHSAEYLLPSINAVFEVSEPCGWVFSRQGLALARLGPEGIIWHTRRLSWDGFDKVALTPSEVTGCGWSAID